MENKIKCIEFTEFLAKFRNGDFTHQRLGQAFCNHFKIRSDQRLFYTSKDGDAIDIIHETYIDYES